MMRLRPDLLAFLTVFGAVFVIVLLCWLFGDQKKEG